MLYYYTAYQSIVGLPDYSKNLLLRHRHCLRYEEVRELPGRRVSVHVPRADEDADRPVPQIAAVQLLRPQHRRRTHRAHQERPHPRLARGHAVAQLGEEGRGGSIMAMGVTAGKW